MKNKMTFILLTTILMLTGCGTQLKQSSDITTIEVGDEFSFVASDYFYSDNSEIVNEIVADVSNVKTNEVGTYPVTVSYKNKEYIVNVNVVDTIAPKISIKLVLPTLEEGSTVKAIDLIDYGDKTTCKAFFIQTDNTEKEEITVAKDNKTVKIVAVDEGGNRSNIIEYTLKIEEVPLSQTEIDILKANADSEIEKEHIEIYESVMKNGIWEDPDWDSTLTVTKIVGTPGDTSWRKLTDEQAKSILETADPDSDEYFEAECELAAGKWSRIHRSTLYYDFYEYLKVVNAEIAVRRNQELEHYREYLKGMEENIEYYQESAEVFGQVYVPKWIIEELGGLDSFSKEVQELIMVGE